MRIKVSIILSFVLLFCFQELLSQVRIIADGRLQTILERHIEYNEMSRSIQGYRIRVNSFTGDNAKAKAFALKNDLQTKYPRTRVYVTFDEPNFIVKIGDYLTRLDAYFLYSELKTQVNTTQIIKDWINNPVISEEDLHMPEYFEEDLEQDF